MTDIKWQAPSNTTRGVNQQGWMHEFADALRSKPGEWAIYKEEASASLASQIQHGKSPAFAPPGAFEGTARKSPSGKHTIYARFVGEVSA